MNKFTYRPTCEVLAQIEQAESDARMEMLTTAILYAFAFISGILATLTWQALL